MRHLALLAAASVLVSCGDSTAPKSVTSTRRVVSDAVGAPEGSTSAARFGMAGADKAHSTESEFRWEVPTGWTTAPARAMRVVTFTAGPEGAVECYVSVLRGDAGGLAANVNRWRRQMGQEALSEEAIAALPKIPVLGRECPLVEVSGDFTGMDQTTQAGAALLGLVCELPENALFVKMTGPSAAVAAERERFEAFCQSLAQAE